MKDELANRDPPDSLDEFINLAIRVDNRIRERRREREQNPAPAPQNLRTPPLHKSPVSPGFSSSALPEAPAEPMELARARLSPTGRQRLFQAGDIALCPLLPKRRGSSGRLGALMSGATSTNSSQTRLTHHNPFSPVSLPPPVGPAPFPNRRSPPADTSPTLDMSLIPPAYHDLAPVFNKEQALSLPPNRPFDCAIDLQAGAPLPTGRLYNLSRAKREAMEKYIRESLQAGLIRPCSSPVAAGFFFVKHIH
ncbi:hypothetical protein Q8A73_000866 [Channa argus]|nr:hypothetical protein Q8A73_000866 [Channa argus]